MDDEFGDLDGDLDGANLNDIIRNALSMALDQTSDNENINDHDNNNTNEEPQLDESSESVAGLLGTNLDSSEYEANRQLLEQLQAVINQDELDTPENDNDNNNNDDDDDQMSDTDINNEIASHLAEIPDVSPSDRPKKPEKELSIAETLALSRSRMKRRNSDKLVDPMVTRYGLQRQQSRPDTGSRVLNLANRINAGTHNTGASTATTSTFPDKQFSATISNSDSVVTTSASNAGISDSAPESSDVVRAFMIAKQAMDEGNNEEPYNHEAMDAVQAVLQALGKTFDHAYDEPSSGGATDTPSDMLSSASGIPSSLERPEKKRRRRIPNTELTEEEKERIRIDNRLRKKKWRGINSDRNKDNDLRARLHRRAVQKFGPGESPDKAAWIDEEFQKRREKRLQRDNNARNGFQKSVSASTLDQLATSITNSINNSNSNFSVGDDSDLAAALETLNQAGQLDLNDAVNSLVKDPSILKTMLDFLADGSSSNENDLQDTDNELSSILDSHVSRVKKSTAGAPSTSSTNKVTAGVIPNHLLRFTTVPSPRPPPYLAPQESDKSPSTTPTPPVESSSPAVEEDSRIKSLGFPPMIGLRSSSHGRA